MSDELELRIAWRQHVGQSDVADRWLDEVAARHREPHRRYHGLRHVVWVVRHVLDFDRHVSLRRPDCVVAAAFFHDAVYDPTRTDNEALSAALARRALLEIGWSDDHADVVATMIERTMSHRADVGDVDTAVLIAADLAVLAAPPARYVDYVTGVRHEYGHVDDHAWSAGRGQVLRAFLERDHVFPAMLTLDEWEHRARANLTAELAQLDG